jgi:alanyl-tRNA synthetase
MTHLFRGNAYLNTITSIITSAFESEGRYFAVLQDNICHPHGGGQKGDRGGLFVQEKEIRVTDTLKDKTVDDGVLLVTAQPIPEDSIGKEVVFRLDWAFRYRQMRLHTALHLHHCLMEQAIGKAIEPPKTSDIQDGFAFNRYAKGIVTAPLVTNAADSFRALVETGAEVMTFPDPAKTNFRWWECLGYRIPCGGTHVANIKEIGTAEVRYSEKKGNPTINIALID